MPDESLFQTVTRNLTPQKDTSRAALGPGHELDLNPGASPQQEGEQQYREKFGSPQEVAYGKIKNWLSEHEQHFSDKILKPFREGLDSMADEIDKSPVVKAASPTAQGVAKGTAELLRAVPIGKNIKETAAAAIVPPDFGSLEGHVLEEAAPKATREATVAVGGTGAASSEELARSDVYVKYSKSGQPTYLGKSPDAALKPGEAILAVNKKTGEVKVQNTSGLADSDALGKFGTHAKQNFAPKDFSKLEGHKEIEPGSEPENEREIRTRTANVKPESSQSEQKFVSPHPEYETSPPGSPAHKQINEWGDKAAKGDETAIQALKTMAGNKIDAQDAKFAQQKLDALKSKVKPIKFNDSEATKGLSDKNKIVIEGIDEPKANPEGRYSDRIKIDPFSKNYQPRKQPIKTA